jgi:hypothetical protein
MAMSNKQLIDRGTYYEIKDYRSIITRDENGNVLSAIHCPYIPKWLVERQEELGPEFSKVLHDNLWDLYNEDKNDNTTK